MAKTRTIADPSVTIAALETCLDSGFKAIGSRDLDEILARAHEQTSWRSTPKLQHLAAVALFILEFVKVCRNGCAPTKKLELALQARNVAGRIKYSDISDIEWFPTRGVPFILFLISFVNIVNEPVSIKIVCEPVSIMIVRTRVLSMCDVYVVASLCRARCEDPSGS